MSGSRPLLEAGTRSARRGAPGACHCRHVQRPDPAAPPSHPAAPSKDAVRGAALLAALAASGWLFPAGAANAATGSRSWRPRRHHRRLGQAEREPDSGRTAKARPAPSACRGLCHLGRVTGLAR